MPAAPSARGPPERPRFLRHHTATKSTYGSASTECESIADPGTLGARAIAGYQRRDRLFAPLVRIVLSRLLGWRYDGLQPARQLVAELLMAEIMMPFARAVAGYWIDLSGLRMGGKRPRRRKCTHEQKDTSEHGEIDRELHGGRAVAIPDQGMKGATDNAGVGQEHRAVPDDLRKRSNGIGLLEKCGCLRGHAGSQERDQCACHGEEAPTRNAQEAPVGQCTDTAPQQHADDTSDQNADARARFRGDHYAVEEQHDLEAFAQD